jgi:hypothetical protein
MWNNLTLQQQQQMLMQMLMSQGQPQRGPVTAMPGGPLQPAMTLGTGPNIPGAAVPPTQASPVPPQMNPAMMQQPSQLMNPLMTGGNSAVNPQQQAQMMQYLAMLQNPQGFGATANSNPAVWQMLMGRSPMYGTGGAVA